MRKTGTEIMIVVLGPWFQGLKTVRGISGIQEQNRLRYDEVETSSKLVMMLALYLFSVSDFKISERFFVFGM